MEATAQLIDTDGLQWQYCLNSGWLELTQRDNHGVVNRVIYPSSSVEKIEVQE